LSNSGKVDCALFGGYVDILKKQMEKSGERMSVIVVQFVKIKIFRGCQYIWFKFSLYYNLMICIVFKFLFYFIRKCVTSECNEQNEVVC